MDVLNKRLKMVWDHQHFDDSGAGAHNADVLREDKVRPAFIDTSGIVYRQIFAKAKEYCKISDNDVVVAHAIAMDSLRDMADACRKFSSVPVLCFDSARNYRKEWYHDYKAGRRDSEKSPEEERCIGLFREVSQLLRKVYAKVYNIQTFTLNGYESDDIIAALVLGLKQSEDSGLLVQPPAYEGEVVIVSNDHDMHQLVLDRVYFADVRSGVLCSSTDILKHWKLMPEDVVPAKVIGGCASDNVKGIPQFGEKTVSQVVTARSFNAVTWVRAKQSLKDVDTILETIECNEALVRLPYKGDREGEEPIPALWLTKGMWPLAGIPDGLSSEMSDLGIPEDMWAMFGEGNRDRRMSNVPSCVYSKRK